MVYTSYFGNLKTLKSAGIVPVSISLWKTDKQEAKLMLRGAATSLWVVTLFICCNCSNDSLIPLILLLINTILIFVNSVLSKEEIKK